MEERSSPQPIENETTNAPPSGRAVRSDAGVQRGPARRLHCGICGAEGVNRVTCTGDAASHAALDRGFKPSPLPVIRGPDTATPGTGTRAAPNSDLVGLTAEEAGRRLQERGAIAADLAHENALPEPAPDEGFVTMREALVHEVVITVVTRYPALVMGRLEHFIEEGLEESLWVSTESHGLTRIEG